MSKSKSITSISYVPTLSNVHTHSTSSSDPISSATSYPTWDQPAQARLGSLRQRISIPTQSVPTKIGCPACSSLCMEALPTSLGKASQTLWA